MGSAQVHHGRIREADGLIMIDPLSNESESADGSFSTPVISIPSLVATRIYFQKFNVVMVQIIYSL